MSRYYLGVDGGQSSTVALIADDAGRVVGYGRGGPCNHVAGSQGREKFIKALGPCLHQAGMQASFDPRFETFRAACLGFSGGADDKVGYSRELIKSEIFTITHDAEIALTGATAGMPGLIIIAGTGSISFGKNQVGKSARAGGWGYIFGDEGGAFDIAREALRAALRMEEGWGPSTALLELLLTATKATTAKQLLHAWYASFDRVAIAQLAPLVSAAAAQNDEPATAILQNAALQLSKIAFGVSRSLFHPDDRPAVSFIGGVFESPLLLNHFKTEIGRELNVAPAAPLFPPAAGALIQAMRSDNNPSSLSNLPSMKQ